MQEQFFRLIKLPELMKRRVMYLWMLNFLYQCGFIIAWVVITALYLQTFGIQNLIWLFLVEAVLLLVGSLIGRQFFLVYPVNNYLYLVATLVMVCLFGEYFLQSQPVLFFALALMAKSLLYPQFQIAFYRKTESLFSPNSARKALPLVETAQTVGTIVSSGFVILLLEVFHTYEVLYFWMIPLAGILFLCAFESKFFDKVEGLSLDGVTKKKTVQPFSWAVYRSLSQKKCMAFLVAMILLKASLFAIVEYEFTKDVNLHFTERKATQNISWDYLQANLLHSAKVSVSEVAEEAHYLYENTVDKLTSASIAQENIAHDLGSLSFLFGLLALGMKLFVTSRVMERFGIFKTIFLYFSGMIWWFLMLAFGQTSMNFVRGYEHGFYSLFASPYHLHFYGTASEDREVVRHALEGFIKPVGTIMGVGLVGLSYLIEIPLAWMMILLCVGVLYCVFQLHNFFGSFTLGNFFKTKNIEEKINILEVIGHPRDDTAPIVLAQRLAHKQQSIVLRKKMVLTLEKMKQPEVIHSYLNILSCMDDDPEIHIHILESLLGFKQLKKYCQNKAFTETRLLETLQTLFEKTENQHLKKLLVMNIFQHISNQKTVDFLRRVLSQSDENIMAVTLRSCMQFEDPEIVSFLEPFLTHKNPQVRSHAVMACWQFGNKAYLSNILEGMFRSGVEENQKISAIYTIGELRLRSFIRRLKHLLPKTQGNLRVHCLIALLKLERSEYLPEFLDIVLGDDDALSIQAFRMRKRLSDDIREKLEHAVHLQVSKRIHDLIQQEALGENWIKKLSRNNRLKLKRFYTMVGGYESIYVLDRMSDS